MTSAAAINQYKQQSTVRAGGGNNVEEEKWPMGRRRDGGQWTIDNRYLTMGTMDDGHDNDDDEHDDAALGRRGGQ